MEPFSISYQSHNPILSFLYLDLKSLISTLLKLFITATKTGSSLINIDISTTSNQILITDIDLGFAAEAKLKILWSKDLVSVSKEIKFRDEARIFLTQGHANL